MVSARARGKRGVVIPAAECLMDGSRLAAQPGTDKALSRAEASSNVGEQSNTVRWGWMGAGLMRGLMGQWWWVGWGGGKRQS